MKPGLNLHKSGEYEFNVDVYIQKKKILFSDTGEIVRRVW